MKPILAALALVGAGCTLDFDPGLLPGSACSATCVAPTPVCLDGRCVVSRAITTMAAGPSHTCATDRLGALWCWGANRDAQLALGSADENVWEPRHVTSTADDWSLVAAGGGGEPQKSHGCGIRAGSLWCWGANSSGESGVGSQVDPISVPTTAGASLGPGWTLLALGFAISCGVRQDGTLWCWGLDENGQLGFPYADPHVTMPMHVGGGDTWRDVALGYGFGCALQMDNTLWCWGDNSCGQLGRSGPATPPGQIDSGGEWSQVATGGCHTCAIRSDGAVWCWGDNTYGQLGIPPSPGNHPPAPVAGPGRASRVAAGGRHTCAAFEDGTIRCWGANEYGQLGAGDIAAQNGLVTLSGQDWAWVIAGEDHTCAVSLDGSPWCWGRGESGQNGTGSRTDVAAPTKLRLVGP